MTYEGVPERGPKGGLSVFQDGMELDPRYSQAVINHSPDGFNWGYGGSGPAQLALALLLEETGRRRALAHYQAFKWQNIARMVQDKPWTLSSVDILDWLNKQEG